MFDLQYRISEYMSEYRYKHTLSVVEECKRLASLFEIDDKELVISAYLHDITKEMSYDQQISLCNEMNITLDKNALLSPKTLHSFSAPALIKRDFPNYYTESIVNAVKYHTTGRADMTLSEKLLYIADYIEPTRKFEDCKALRKYFYDSQEILNVRLDKAMLLSLKYTLTDLTEQQEFVHPETVNAYNYFVKVLECKK